MADHRVTDLSYGHLGKASYDTEENEWKFSVNLDQKSSIQQLIPFKEWLPPSIREIPQIKEKPSLVLKSQRKWLLKARPEIFPADVLASNLSKSDLSRENEIPTQVGSLLALGRAVDVDRVSGSRTTQILAIPYGDAGHILRLVRPRPDTRGWGKHSAARLSLLDSDSPEYGHWVGEAGVIRQILASDTENGSGTWLAVRQDTTITIFRPQYGRLHNPSTSSDLPEKFPISQLNPNPVATLTTERTQSRTHADATFNPWYARQFAVVDTLGVWSIWELDYSHSKKKSQILVPGRRGGIYDDYKPDLLQKLLDTTHFDGWYKILWVCNISMLVVCNRRHLAVVDLTNGTSQLQDADIVLPKSQDWILDIKRSTASDSRLFILTTSRIFLVEIALREDDNQESSSAKIVLSYRHFRNADDETMKLVVLKDHTVSVMITSTISPLVHVYCFSQSTDHSAIPSSYQGSFSFSSKENQKLVGSALAHICFLSCQLTPSDSMKSSGPGLQYLEHGVRFLQVWALGRNLELSSTLFAINESLEATRKSLNIEFPSSRVRHPRRRFGARVIEESFIVPDGEDDEEDIDVAERNALQQDMQAMLLDEWQDDLRFRIDWRRVYRSVFGLDSEAKRPPSEVVPTMEEIFERVSDRIHHGLETNELPTSTFTELSDFKMISEDLEVASQAFQDFLQSLEPYPDSEEATALVLSNVGVYSEGQLSQSKTPKPPDMSSLYDQMAEYWMATVPPNLSNAARIARYRAIRQLAIGVCFSSIAISVENKSVSAERPPGEKDDARSVPILDKISGISGISRESSPTFFSSQLAAIPDREPDFRLPTPAKTPSIYSHTTSASEIKEDPAITRLRQYAISIKAKPDLGPPSLLSHWPSRPGADPAEYSYEDAQKAAVAAESGDESEYRNRKEEARRRRRTEKFLRQERSRAVEAAAQSIFMPSGSQPAVLHEASSQQVPDLPMTQPELGIFGSRAVQEGKKRNKKPRTAGFR